MNSEARDRLCELVAAHGAELVTDWKRLRNLLRDHCPEHRKEVFVLVAAAEARVAADLAAAPPFVPRAVLHNQLVRRLHHGLAMTPEAAEWAVEVWAEALAVGREEGEVPDLLVVAADGTGHFRTIADAVEVAPAGAQIQVRPGHYSEELVLLRRVELVAVGPVASVVVQAPCALTVDDVEAVVVRGIAFHGSPSTDPAAPPVVRLGRGRAILERCRVRSASPGAGVEIFGPHAAPLLRQCRVQQGAGAGIVATDGCRGTVEDSFIGGQAEVGIAIADEGDLTVSRCRIASAGRTGVRIWRGGLGVLEQCDVVGHSAAGVEVTGSGNPVLWDCRIHHGLEHGVVVAAGGRGTFDGCAVFANGGDGFDIAPGGDPLLVRCTVTANNRAGVRVAAQATATVEDCELGGNARGAWAVAPGADVRQARVRADDPPSSPPPGTQSQTQTTRTTPTTAAPTTATTATPTTPNGATAR